MDAVEEKAIVAILPKPAFRPLIEIATTRAGSDVTLINEPPLANNELEAAESCCWRRWGRVQPPSNELSRNLGGFKPVQLPG